jgi:uncharacterized protein (DUF1800 family)
MNDNAFDPFVADSTHPFDSRRAAHLLRRSGFGASPEEIRRAVEKGLEETVEGLFQVPAAEDTAYQSAFELINGRLMDFADIEAVRAWWVFRMMTTKAPLREKLALFWHGHFATSAGKVEDARLMHGQVETFRRLAWGNFRELALAIARDPAMLVWLDGESSTKEHPNENFGRELLELFTCGIGQYSEADVQAAARAFTGWQRSGAAFAFNAEAHDGGVKRFLGKSGRFDGGDIIDILMQQPATPRLLARKLLRFFASPEPPEDVVDQAALVLDRTQLDIKWFLRELFLSRYFHSDTCYRVRIASPAELVVGAVRTLDVRWTAAEAAGDMAAMGQDVLAPPSVKGWDGEQAWINTNTWAARRGFAQTLAQLAADGDSFGPRLDISRIVPAELTEPDAVVGRIADVLVQGDLPASVLRDLALLLVRTEDGRDPAAFRADAALRETRAREAIAVVLSLPEAQTY